jgi:hypothetical protein
MSSGFGFPGYGWRKRHRIEFVRWHRMISDTQITAAIVGFGIVQTEHLT